MTTLDKKAKFKLSERNLAVLVFSLFFSWLLSIPFEGKTLYLLLAKFHMNVSDYIFKSIAAHLLGLISCWLFIKNIRAAKKLIYTSIAACILGTSVFFFKPSQLWQVSLIVCSFLSGASVAGWAFYFKETAKSDERMKMAADGLIFSNVLMICINIAASTISVYVGLLLSTALLVAGFIFALKLPEISNYEQGYSSTNISVSKPLTLLCIFIVIITINSGLMYQVINPNFSHHETLVSWYWAMPYIASIIIMRRLSSAKRTYMLYVAIALMGLGFVSFLVLNNSAVSYILIDTLMLSAFGIYDFFWWSAMGEMLDYTHNPSRLMGIVLSANVMGVLAGGYAGSIIYSSGNNKFNSSLLALVVVFVILIILPVLHNQLNAMAKSHFNFESKKKTEKLHNALHQLTDRETQVAELLLKGRTYKMIAEELYLSENTVKTHIKNIYSKLNIQSKTELIKMLNKQ